MSGITDGNEGSYGEFISLVRAIESNWGYLRNLRSKRGALCDQCEHLYLEVIKAQEQSLKRSVERLAGDPKPK